MMNEFSFLFLILVSVLDFLLLAKIKLNLKVWNLK